MAVHSLLVKSPPPWADMESRIEGLLEIGTKTRRDDADGVYGAQMYALNRDLGRLHAHAAQIKEIASASSCRARLDFTHSEQEHALQRTRLQTRRVKSNVSDGAKTLIPIPEV